MKTCVLPFLLCSLAWSDSWNIQYFHDEDKSTLALTSIQFPSAQRGLASGVITERSGRVQPVVMVTSNGGEIWSAVRSSEPGRSLFCLDETACWMVTPKGLWFSTEAGRNWSRVKRESNLLGCYFTSRERGWLYGAEKKLLETRDGGKTWSPVPEAVALKTSTDRTVFHAISFLNAKAGVLAGRSEPVQSRRDVPLWMDSEPELRKERPALTILLETRDGGETWTENATSMFGRMAKFTKPSPSGAVLGLVEFDRYFQYASEVYRYAAGDGKLTRTLRSQELAVTDIAVVPSGRGVVAAFQPLGKLARTPVPGKVRMFEAADLEKWAEVPVDYRAVARKVHLGAVDDDHMWIATDTGMILKLQRGGTGSVTKGRPSVPR